MIDYVEVYSLTSTKPLFNSFYDYGLIITNADIIGEPVIKANYVDIPFRNGFIDLTETVTGNVTYSHREIKIEFACEANAYEATQILSNLRRQIHGKTCKFEFSFFPNLYCKGRVSVSVPVTVGNYTTFTLSMPTAEPYFYNKANNTEVMV